MDHHSDLTGRIVLITGASRGIGEALARLCSQAGARLALVARSRDRLRALCDELPGKAVPIPADLADPASPGRIVARVSEELGGLDVLVNNAGIARGGSLEETALEEWDLHLKINVTAPFLLTRAALPLLRQSDAARVVNMGSVVSHKGYEKQGAYTASKHAVYGFTKVLARELHEERIRVHFVAPGAVATGMISGVRPDLDPGELIAPEEVARAVLYLLSQGPSAATDELSLRRDGSAPWK